MIFVIGTLLFLKWLEIVKGSELAIHPLVSLQVDHSKPSARNQIKRNLFCPLLNNYLTLKDAISDNLPKKENKRCFHVIKRDLKFNDDVPFRSNYVESRGWFNPLSFFRTETKRPKGQRQKNRWNKKEKRLMNKLKSKSVNGKGVEPIENFNGFSVNTEGGFNANDNFFNYPDKKVHDFGWLEDDMNQQNSVVFDINTEQVPTLENSKDFQQVAAGIDKKEENTGLPLQNLQTLRVTQGPKLKVTLNNKLTSFETASGASIIPQTSLPVKNLMPNRCNANCRTTTEVHLECFGSFDSFDEIYNQFAGELTTCCQTTCCYQSCCSPTCCPDATEYFGVVVNPEDFTQGIPECTTETTIPPWVFRENDRRLHAPSTQQSDIYDLNLLERLLDNHATPSESQFNVGDAKLHQHCDKFCTPGKMQTLTMSPVEFPFKNSLREFYYPEKINPMNKIEKEKHFGLDWERMNGISKHMKEHFSQISSKGEQRKSANRVESDLQDFDHLSSSELSYLFDVSVGTEETLSTPKNIIPPFVDTRGKPLKKLSDITRLQKHDMRRVRHIPRRYFFRNRARYAPRQNNRGYMDSFETPGLRHYKFHRRTYYPNFRKYLKAARRLKVVPSSMQSHTNLVQKGDSAGIEKNEELFNKGIPHLGGQFGVQDALSIFKSDRNLISAKESGMPPFNGPYSNQLNQPPSNMFTPIRYKEPFWNLPCGIKSLSPPITVQPHYQSMKEHYFKPHYGEEVKIKFNSKMLGATQANFFQLTTPHISPGSPLPLLSYEIGFQVPLPEKPILLNLGDSNGHSKALTLSLNHPGLNEHIKVLSLKKKSSSSTPYQATILKTGQDAHPCNLQPLFFPCTSTMAPYLSMCAVPYAIAPCDQMIFMNTCPFTSPQPIIALQANLDPSNENFQVILPKADSYISPCGDPTLIPIIHSASSTPSGFLIPFDQSATCQNNPFDVLPCGSDGLTTSNSVITGDDKQMLLMGNSAAQCGNMVWSTSYPVPGSDRNVMPQGVFAVLADGSFDKKNILQQIPYTQPPSHLPFNNAK